MKDVMELNKIIKTAENFQYAINIAYDFSSNDKIENYIPTNDAIRIIEDILLSTKLNSTDRARLFVGAYGKGKSHLALILIALVYNKDLKLFSNLLTKIKDINLDLYEYLINYINSDNRLLPVVVEGNKSSLQQSLLSALKNALDRENISDIMPNTFFDISINTIEMWKRDYKKTYKQFGEMLDCKIDNFISRLKNYEHEALNIFSELYPKLTAGSNFSPILNGDVVSVYSDVIQEIEKFGFNGIFLVYDEFSKYLEGNINTTSASDIKVLQDLAEKANRSGAKQLHLLMISHKNIINYIDELPKTKIDAWKAVSERFKTVELSSSPIQLYNLISHVVIKEEDLFEQYYNENEDRFKNILDLYTNRNMFTGISKDDLNKIIKGCFPLEPTSIFMLPIISEKVAQNERSMFTFLSSKNDKNALFNVLTKTANYITPDYIYDYFEEQFKNEAYTSDVHKYWKLVITSINILNNPNELKVKLIKCLALIYILDKKELIKPSSDNLLLIYATWGFEKNEVIKNIEELKELGVFKFSSRTNYLRLSERTDINVEDIIQDMIERRRTSFDPLQILNKEANRIFLYPNKYNDINEITRYFTFEFISPQQSEEVEDWNKRIEDRYASGTLFAIYSPKGINDTEWLKKIIDKRSIFAIVKKPNNIEGVLKQYDALSILIENSDDELFKEELAYTFDDLHILIQKYLEEYINPSLNQATYYYKGKVMSLGRKSQLSNLLSTICNEVYLNTPIIVNEVINKNKITKQAINSRHKVVEGLLENEIKENLGLSGNGQDVSFFRSVIKNTGIYKEDNNKYMIVTERLQDEKLNYVLKVIKDFLLSTTEDGAKSIELLYKQLIDISGGIGIKLGIVPFFFAAILHHYKRFVVITKKGKELSITASLLDSINENPNQYELILESWSQEKEAYIVALEEAFEPFLVVNEKEYNTFDYIVKAMQRWFFRLPKYSKEAYITYINPKYKVKVKSVKRFRESLKVPEINSREFLFEKIPSLYGYNVVGEQLALDVKISKEILDDLLIGLQKDIGSVLLEELSDKKNDKRPLYTVAKDWYETLEDKTKEYLFSNGEGKLLSIIGNVNNDISGFVKRVARELSGLHIEDWNDDTFEKFRQLLIKQLDNIKSFNDNSTEDSENTKYRIIVTDEYGNQIEKMFDKVRIPQKGKLLYNELISNVSEYGNALSDGEKRQILMDVMIGYLK